MPISNRFRHQSYDNSDTQASIERCQASPGPNPDSHAFRQRMQGVGSAYRKAGVAAIYLIHGTFVGADGAGFIRELSRVAPQLGAQLRRLRKLTVDRLASDAGNYTIEYAHSLGESLSTPDGQTIPVRCFCWSSENHHVGRADGAIRLLDALYGESLSGNQRLLLWGHSHGGNLLAILSNLLANDLATNDRFFHAARTYYKSPFGRTRNATVWHEVEQRLTRGDTLGPLDMVTFGTPVRYGWDSNGYAQLMHFIHHREAGTLPQSNTVAFPPSFEDLRYAASGDVIQHLGIAGTNLTPPIWAWPTWLAEIRLNHLLQRGLRHRDLVRRLKYGRRTHHEGLNLLVDYGSLDDHAGHIAGHAVYTRRHWQLFHSEEIARRLYGFDPHDQNTG